MTNKFLRRAVRLSLKSGCLRAKRGTVLVRNGEVLAEAYNKVFPSNDFCKRNGCLRDKLGLGLGKEAEKCRSIHSEALAICLAAKRGINLDGVTAYITCAPCMNCAKLLVSSGIKEVYYLDEHGDKTSLAFLDKMGVICKRLTLVGDDPALRLRDARGQ